MNDLYSDYAILDAQEKEIKKLKESKRLEIMQHMQVNGETKIQHTFGSFSLSKLKKWEYPEYITKMEDDFKAKKALAESTGEATYTETDSLRFTSVRI